MKTIMNVQASASVLERMTNRKKQRWATIGIGQRTQYS